MFVEIYWPKDRGFLQRSVFILFIHLYEYESECVHVCMYTMYMTGPHGTAVIAMSCCHVGDEYQTWVLCQNNKKKSS